MSDTVFGRDTVMDGDAAAAGLIEKPFHFRGNGSEYFGIWIVNILLTVITLGIYSAWAKVRNKRYFNGNTEVDGHTFDYHAEPVKILIGRIIVLVVLLVLNFMAYLHIATLIIAVAIYVIALPWVIVRGLRFNANMTSYRNVRFHFQNKKRYAFLAFIVWPILAMFSLGTLIPFASRSRTRFLGNGHSYGTSSFSADPPLKPYYKGLGLAALVGVGALAGIFILTSLSAISSDLLGTVGAAGALLGVVLGLFLYLVFFVAIIIYVAIERNVSFAALNLEGGHRFRSTVEFRPYTIILVTNFILIIITLGLFIPWAKVRLARYLADNTFMLANGDLDSFVARQTDETGVASGEFLDIEGFDFGF